ncbi:MAG: DUF1698 domain-containing protein [Deltaproteobacteria bacterium]|nr:DUF1698 domain-containing protein [Deltaproteobacteria bacterium]
MDRIPKWVHRIDLGGGVVTPGAWNSDETWRRLGVDVLLKDKSVLDVGSWDGYYAFRAEQAGARRVKATDWYCWGGPGWGTKDGFDLVHEVLESNVESQEIDVLDLSPQAVGRFDAVLFLGVLYHMQHPMLALEKVASVTRELLVVETLVDLVHLDRPALAFYPGSSLEGDHTNWFGPNEAAVKNMLLEVGFSRVERVWPAPLQMSAWRWASRVASLLSPSSVNPHRMTFHAWKD